MKSLSKTALLNFDANIDLYQNTLIFLSFYFSRRNTQVIRIGCQGVLGRCTNLNSAKNHLAQEDLSELKKIECPRCIQNQSRLFANEAAAVSEQDHLTPEQNAFVEHISHTLQQHGNLASVLTETFSSLEFCKLASFDFCIVQKVSDKTPLTDKQRMIFLVHLRDHLMLFNFTSRNSDLLKNTSFIYVNGNAGLNHAFGIYCKAQPEQLTSIEPVFSCQDPLNRIFFQQDRLPLVPKWDAIQVNENNFRFSKKDAERALNVFRQRFIGNDFNSYTHYKKDHAENQNFLNFKQRHQRVISLFLSSSDELYSHVVTHQFEPDQSLFAHQTDAIEHLIHHTPVSTGLVIRVHPRLVANKRDSVISEEASKIGPLLELARQKSNILVIEAGNSISSYYILMNSDACLVTWSTMGVECLTAGVPCYALFPGNCMYPIHELVAQPRTKQELFDHLAHPEKIVAARLNNELILKWISMVYSFTTVETPVIRNEATAFWPRASRKIVKLAEKRRSLQKILFSFWILFFGNRLTKSLQQKPLPSPFCTESQGKAIGRLRHFRQELQRHFCD